MAKQVIKPKPVPPPKPIIKIIDDFDGKPLPGDTKAVKYNLKGKTYNLYLSAASKEAVDTFLNDLLDGAERINSSAGRAVSGREKEAAKKAYAAAHGEDPKKIRYTKRIAEWYKDNK